MIILGLTGSIGMGKTTAADIFRDMGVPVHASDDAVRTLLAPGGAGVEPVLKAFPDTGDGKGGIDRAALGHIVFNDAAARKRLEAILHPPVVRLQQEFLAAQKKLGAPVVVLDIPLLYETGAEKRVDYVIVMTAPYEIQRERVMARGMTEEHFHARLATQVPDEEKRKRADFVVQTERGLDYTRTELRNILDRVKGPMPP
jgi:dephospho-CoA kinase